jgi:tRNA-specific 2-thiouridylase
VVAPRERVVVAMSGGVDSSVAALLEREAGRDVVGLFLRNGVTGDAHAARPGHQGCCSVEDAADARRVADALGIDFYALDYGGEFERLIESFVDDYAAGRTPSPCVLCNRWLKFGSLVAFARRIGASAVATGHYARISETPGGPRRLLRAADRAKDQSYFLAGLAPEQLAWCRFPVGGMTKDEVRARARAAGLRTAEKPESMEICFVPGGDYRTLVASRAPGAMREGEVVDESGAVLGRHGGHAAFTIGQRRGIGVAAAAPRYVTAIDPRRNLVVVGPRASLAKESLTADRFVWTSRGAPPAGESIDCAAQIRHRHVPAPAIADALPDGRVRVRFAAPVEAAAPGQAVALYDGDVVLGGGFIAEAG